MPEKLESGYLKYTIKELEKKQYPIYKQIMLFGDRLEDIKKHRDNIVCWCPIEEIENNPEFK